MRQRQRQLAGVLGELSAAAFAVLRDLSVPEALTAFAHDVLSTCRDLEQVLQRRRLHRHERVAQKP